MSTGRLSCMLARAATRTGRVLLMPLCLIPLLTLCGCGKDVDPVDQIRMLVPEIAAALNQKDIGGLRWLGTRNLEANRLIVDIFADGGDGTVTLGFKRVRMLGDRAELTVEVRHDTDRAAPRELLFALEGNGRWRIDSYTFPVPDADSTSPATTDST